ncbi:MAG: AAA family ATPase [Eubacterium sp.]|nr:AAA family ATPase [Eubacterium sp.]
MNEKMIPNWQRELKTFVSIKPAIIMDGEIYDEYPYYTYENGQIEYYDSDDIYHVIESMVDTDVFDIIIFDPIYGFYCHANTLQDQRNLLQKYLKGYNTREELKDHGNTLCLSLKDDSRRFVQMSQIVRRGITDNNSLQAGDTISKKVLFILDLSSRYDGLNENQTWSNEMYTNLLKSTYAIQGDIICNGFIMLVDSYKNIPDWFYLNNPGIRAITVTLPERDEKRNYISNLYEPFDIYSTLSNPDNEAGAQFLAETEGLQMREIKQILKLARKNNYSPDQISQAFRLYKYGIIDSPWDKLGSDIMNRVNKELENVIGQEEAINKVKTVVSRAIKGFSGLMDSKGQHRPKGALFFAGPTGVGKTETAKALARAIFGDENACVRFDMSEFREEHSEAKLFGAPPGYIGYEGGGQLTNALKEKPFCILLFDEIEKAHPSILDKFLQILEDGRMTDGQGNTVYFGETLIIFTSNIGTTKLVYESDDFLKTNPKREPTIVIPNVEEADSDSFKEEVNCKLKDGVKNYFINNGRPELLNRLGENNIIVFQFIDKAFAEEICEKKINKLLSILKEEKGLKVEMTDSAMTYVKHKAVLDRQSGGRGVGNMIENQFINVFSDTLDKDGLRSSHYVCQLGEAGDKLIFISQNENDEGSGVWRDV